MDQQTRRFGLYEVSILHDGFYEAPIDVLTHAAGPAARDGAIATWGRPTLRIVVNCFLLRGPAASPSSIAGTGTAWGEAYGHARTALKSFGLTRESVDRVLITHLHGDHALGLFDGEAAYFPHARVSFRPQSSASSRTRRSASARPRTVAAASPSPRRSCASTRIASTPSEPPETSFRG